LFATAERVGRNSSNDGQHTGYNAQETFLSTSTVPKLLERLEIRAFLS